MNNKHIHPRSALCRALIDLIGTVRDPGIRDKLRFAVSGPSGHEWGSQSRGRMFLALTGCSDRNLSVAAAIELWHNASLIIDDAIDSGQIRRNGVSFWRKYSKEDVFALSFVMDRLAMNSVLDVGGAPLVSLFVDCSLRMALVETNTQVEASSFNSYYSAVSGKTASFYETVWRAANLTNGIDTFESDVSIVHDCGVAHQFIDDWKDRQFGIGNSATARSERRLNWCFLPTPERIRAMEWFGGFKTRLAGFEINSGANPADVRALLDEIGGADFYIDHYLFEAWGRSCG